MKISIRKKMFIISMATTILSFVLIMICFNLICNSYIERQSVSDLLEAAESAKLASIDYSIKAIGSPSALAITATTATAITAASIVNKSFEAVDVLQKEFIRNGSPVKIVVTEGNETMYPVELSIPEESYNNEDDVRALKSYITINTAKAPKKITLNEGIFYAMATSVDTDTTAILYKDVKALEDLVSNVNAALLVLLLLCGVITVVTSMLMSNGIVRSLRQLCGFAEDIGSGDLRQRDFIFNELELSILANDMNFMAKQLSNFDAEQKTFFQNVSHELRTPLMSIQGYAEGITSGVFEEDKSKEAAEIILNESDRLTAMVEELLCLSRVDTLQLDGKIEIFDCVEILKLIVHKARAICNDINISLEVSICDNADFILEGNAEEFEKAILNVLTNCIRYANEKIIVSCDCENRKIIIFDDGPGIKDEDKPFIFKRFYKGEGGCTGIGLAISKAVIDKMGGIITAHNGRINDKCGKGAVFTISLN